MRYDTIVSTVVNSVKLNVKEVARAEDTHRTVGCCGSVLAEPLSERDADELAGAFAALSDPVRLRLLSIIASSDEVCSCDLEGPLQAQPAHGEPPHEGARRSRPDRRRKTRQVDVVARRTRARRGAARRALLAGPMAGITTRQPITASAVWNAADVGAPESWTYVLDAPGARRNRRTRNVDARTWRHACDRDEG